MDNPAPRSPPRFDGPGRGFDFRRRTEGRRGEPLLGFHESSFDLRRGLDVVEMSVATLPDEVMSEFRRQRGVLRVSP